MTEICQGKVHDMSTASFLATQNEALSDLHGTVICKSKKMKLIQEKARVY